MKKYIIYTCGNKQINEAVQKVLFEKGYVWQDGKSNKRSFSGVTYLEEDGSLLHGDVKYADKVRVEEGYKELTFRELFELPPVHDEVEELADHIVSDILAFWNDETYGPIKDMDWCKVRDQVKEKLDL